MNNKGKGNALFVLLIPVFFMIALVIIDTVVSYTQSKTYKEVTERVIKEVVSMEDIEYDDYYLEIKKAYERRGYETDRLVVNASENEIIVENEHLYFGVFTSLGNKGQEEEIAIFGIEFLTFNLRKNSKTIVNVEARYDNNNELIFEYIK